MNSTFVQMVSWWWSCQTCVVTDVLSSCLAVPSLSRPWMTCGILAQAVVVLQFQFSSSPSPPPRAPSGLAGALRPAWTTIASQAPASTSYTCVVDLLFRRTLTVVHQAAGLAPPMGCRWNLASRLHHLPHLLCCRHTSRHLAAFCIPLPSSIPALSQSEGIWGRSKLSGTLHGLLFVKIFKRCWYLHRPWRNKDKKCIYLTLWKRMDLLPVLGALLICLNPLFNWDTWTLCPLWNDEC